VKKLITRLPSLKVIYLIRDPRGILSSQFGLLVNEGENISIAASTLCGKMEEDLRTYEEFEVCSGPVLRVIYEELCQFPFVTVSKIYDFFNVTFTEKSGLTVVKNKMTGPLRSCDYCTTRGDAVTNAYRWINGINKGFLHTVNKHCSAIYSKLGYLNLKYDNLRSKKSSWQPPQK
jgi:hypothetical protein